ncbi:MAG TPA: thioester reductase domain-containing protein, partial [Solirubrobacteraceae bacterium]
AVSGDLEKPRLGLAAARFDRLAEQLDAIYHNGARVNLTDPYVRCRATNVGGTHEILRLAARGRLTPVHHVSTAAVLVSVDGDPAVLLEDRRLAPELVPPSGYVRSKWVAEELVHIARARGIPTSIFRPAQIGGHSVTGAMTSNDALWHRIRACIETAMMPDPTADGAWAEVDLVPVDYVAQAYVHLAQQPDCTRSAFHLTHPKPTAMAAIMDHARLLGYEIETVPPAEWERRVMASAEAMAIAGDGHDSSVQSAAILNGAASDAVQTGRWRFDRSRTARALGGSGIICPLIDRAMLDRYFRYHIQSGFLPAAPNGARV